MSDELRVELRPDATDELTTLLRERIVILDGAMGTAIQRDRPSEAGLPRRALRRLADRPPGQQRPAVPDPAGDHRDHPPRVPPGRRGHRRDQHLQRDGDLAGRLRPRGPRLRDQPRVGLAGAAGLRRGVGGDPERPRYVAGALGPTTAPRPSRPTSTTPAPATCPTTSWSRRTPTPAAASTAVPTSSSSRRSSTPSTPRRRSSRSRRCSRTTAAGGR